MPRELAAPVTDVPPSPLPPHEARRLWETASHDREAFSGLVRRRVEGEPLQYLEGTAAFGPFDLAVDPRVLIPRPETEQLWELARRSVRRPPRLVVDLCTGSGALAIACRSTWPEARVVATDASAEALEVARANIDEVGMELELYRGDLFEALPADLVGACDLVVSNPPYVAEEEWGQLPADVRREPRMALVAGPSGTEILDRIAAGSPPWLTPGGTVVCEIGETQGLQMRERFELYFRTVTVEPDLTGRDRFVVAGDPRV